MKENTINPEKLPQHLAIIMDGNGRWAKQQGFLRTIGHENGATAVKRVIEQCARLGIPYLTLYAFSTENWNRPKFEVDMLMKLLVKALKKEFKTLQDNNIKLNAIGNLELLPASVRKELTEVLEKTKNNTRLTVSLALSYGSRNELIEATKQLCNKVKNNIISVDAIDETVINEHLYTHNLPDVDLLIRTSGEQRISNFLLWQIAYAELYFTNVLWPDFSNEHLFEALEVYQNRERRYGKTSEQLNK
ncbi:MULTISPECIES: isoprenyl transferase [unclassified Flavobacterium]|uniref:isoprenyl transferase n=1 Tax=unclassified Flavobacterium TaxID=196869 RepID=UPI0013D271C7|nr:MULTISPECIES: isoprenyl transferase [unclassified Flavobacterium]MBA5792368.1 isoprenyl transferase [Flavobacterium sp. xlx-221]